VGNIKPEWPSEWKGSGLNAKNNRLSIEILEIRNEGFSRSTETAHSHAHRPGASASRSPARPIARALAPVSGRQRMVTTRGRAGFHYGNVQPYTMRVFIASSSEQIAVARKVSEALAVDELTAKVWDEETFNFSAGFIESLEEELERADFAVVVLTADDHATMREKQVDLPRDNVIFELGLFIGRLGRERCFFLIDGTSQTEVASDLSGVNPVKFYGEGAPSSPGRRTLGEQLERVRKQMLDQGVRYKPTRGVRADQDALWRFSTRIAGHWWERMRAGEDDKSAISYVKMSVDEVTNTPALRGWSYDLDGEFLAEWHTVVSGVALKQATIYYRWEGGHEKEHAQTYGGGGHIVFDDDELASGSGYYYDTNFADIAEGSHTRVKHFGLYKCDKEDEPVMKRPQSAEAKKLASTRARTLDGR
jgi:hypothetical protein